MSRLRVLTKYFVRDALQDMFNKSKMKSGLMIVLMIILIAFLSLPFVIVVNKLYEPFAMIGQEGALLSLILLVGAIISFFLGIFIIMNTYYFSNDIEYFLPMPFKSSEIVLSKFIAVLINMLLYSTIIVVPLLVFAKKSSASFMYYIYIVLSVVICPILPMIIAALVCMFLMRFTNLSKHKDMFRTISGCLSLVLVIGLNMISQSTTTLFEDSSSLVALLNDNNSFMDVLSGIFITNKYASYGLLYNSEIKGFIYMLISIIICVALCIGYYLIGGKLYLKSVIGISETYSKRVNIFEENGEGNIVKRSSPIKALVIRDIKMVFRTPQFFINSIMMMIYMPALLAIISLVNGQFANIKYVILSGKYNSTIIAGAFFLSAMSITSAGGGRRCLSREGSDFVFSKIIPIAYTEQAKSKIISSLCINSLLPIIIVIISLLLGVDFLISLLCLVSSILGTAVITLIQILLDFMDTKLEWSDEKNLYNGDISSAIMSIIIILLGVGVIAISVKVENYIGMFLVISALSLILIGVFYKKVINMSDEVYRKN